MNKLCYALLVIGLFSACREREIHCDEGEGQRFEVKDQKGWVFFDDRFDTYVVRQHVEGTIDSFRTYVICNVAEELKGEEQSIVFSGEAQSLKKKYQPSMLIAGEAFFVIFLGNVTLHANS